MTSFSTCFAASGNELYIFRQCTYIIVSIAPKKLSNCLKRAETSVVLIVFDCVLYEVRAYKNKCCYCFLPSLNMNQVPEKDILVRNQIQMYNKKYPVNTMWLLEQNKCRIKKKSLTGQRRNTIILKHLMFQSFDYPHFICISFRQFNCYIYIILWAPNRSLHSTFTY